MHNNYSEALLARKPNRKTNILKEWETNGETPVISLAHSEEGRSFQEEGHTTANAQRWTKLVLVPGKNQKGQQSARIEMRSQITAFIINH